MESIKCFPLEDYCIDISRFETPKITITMNSMNKEKVIEFAKKVDDLRKTGCNYKVTIEEIN